MVRENSKAGLPQGSPLVVYREIAGKYVADYQKLKPFSAMPPAADSKEAHERLEALKTVTKKLATRGRAKFNVGVWQLRWQREIETFDKLKQEALKAQQQKNMVPTYDQQLPQFHQLLTTSKFGEASGLLKKASLKKGQQNQRAAWIYFSDSAATFIRELEQGIADQSISIELETVDGKVYQKVLAAKAGGLSLEEETGNQVFMTWANIKPEGVLRLYREVFDLTVDTLEGQRRTEQAVCYAWLMGMQDKAKEAAGKLSLVNGNFQKRWANTTSQIKPTE